MRGSYSTSRSGGFKVTYHRVDARQSILDFERQGVQVETIARAFRVLQAQNNRAQIPPDQFWPKRAGARSAFTIDNG